MTQIVYGVQYIWLGIIANNSIMQNIIVLSSRKMQKK